MGWTWHCGRGNDVSKTTFGSAQCVWRWKANLVEAQTSRIPRWWIVPEGERRAGQSGEGSGGRTWTEWEGPSPHSVCSPGSRGRSSRGRRTSGRPRCRRIDLPLVMEGEGGGAAAAGSQAPRGRCWDSFWPLRTMASLWGEPPTTRQVASEKLGGIWQGRVSPLNILDKKSRENDDRKEELMFA